MKINGFAILSLFSLVSGSVARPGNRFRAYDDNDPIDQKSQVTAFINTDKGLKVECWSIGDLLPQNQVTRADGSKGTVRRKKMVGNISISLFSFSPSVTLFSFGATGVHSNAIDFRAKPNLFTIKDGLILIEALGVSGGDVTARDAEYSQYVFADLNGDDWFYFEDQTYDDKSSSSSSSQEQCAKPTAESHFSVRTISGSDTTLINFQYESTPEYKVLHEGRCNFAGLKPVSPSSQSDPTSKRFRFQSQDL